MRRAINNTGRWIGILLLVAMVGVCLRPVREVVTWYAWLQPAREVRTMIDTLEERRPPDVSPQEWAVADFWIGVANANICFSPEHVSYGELLRYREDVRAELSRPVDFGTIDRLWRRLAATGPHGKQYVEQFEPYYREELETARDRN